VQKRFVQNLVPKHIIIVDRKEGMCEFEKFQVLSIKGILGNVLPNTFPDVFKARKAKVFGLQFWCTVLANQQG